jgi:phosphohistidine phosphatase SixA
MSATSPALFSDVPKILRISVFLLWLSSAGCNAPPPQTEVVPSEAPASPAIAPSETNSDLWTQLQQQNAPYFVLMRHAIAPGSGDPANFQIDDCSTQRNLSDEGRSQAQRTGDAFRDNGVTVDRVLSSQWCRCLETAELLDLASAEPYAPLNSFFRDRATEPQQTAQVRQYMAAQDDPGVTVMVTHFVNIAALTGSGISSGEMVVVRVNDQDQLEVLGQIEPF